MKQIKFYVIPYEEIMEFVKDERIPEHWLKEYLSHRPGILNDVDIFCKNCRSENQPSNFEIFNRVNTIDEADIAVFSIYLELFEFAGVHNNILKCVEHYSKKYQNKLIIFHWNHDDDFANYGYEIEKYENVYVNNFGYTSKKFKNNILLPFWVINTKQYKEKRVIPIGFIGNPNNEFRKKIVTKISHMQKPSYYYYGQAYPQENYYKTVSSCLFNLCPRGGGGNGGFSYRFFECFHLNSIPVLISDTINFPYQNKLDYNTISVHVAENKIENLEELKKQLFELNYKQMLETIEQKRMLFTLKGVQEEIYDNLIVKL
jgi:hypothetical protein